MRHLPDGLTVINFDARCYRYTEPSDETFDPGFVDFVIFADGSVEVASAGAPFVPAAVLRWIADLAEEGVDRATGG